MALTKADMAESLFNELGLNKREARGHFYELDVYGGVMVGSDSRVHWNTQFDFV